MPEMKQLRCFVSCVQEGSFSRAAEVLYTSQPNVSKIIRELEIQLEMRLFVRSGRGIVPTPEGEQMYQYALEILSGDRYITDLAKNANAKSLRISLNPSRSLSYFLTHYCAGLKEDLSLQVLESNTVTVVQNVERYRSDLGFVFLVHNQEASFQYMLSRKGLFFEKLWESYACLCVGNQNKLYEQESVGLKELQTQRFIRTGDDFFSIENGICTMEKSLKRVVDKAVITNSNQVLIHLISSTSMCCLAIPTFLSSDPYENFKMIPVVPPIRILFGCISRGRDHLKEEAARFLDGMMTHL